MKNNEHTIVQGERVIVLQSLIFWGSGKSSRKLIRKIALIAQFLGDGCSVDPSIVGPFIFSDTSIPYGREGKHRTEAAT